MCFSAVNREWTYGSECNIESRKSMKLTTIVPCYNEQEALELFYEELNRVTKQMSDVIFEILFI